MTKKAIYPGSFDPITFGHIDIARRALTLVDHLVIAVGINANKHPLFTAEERVTLIKDIFKNEPRISVTMFDGLLINFAKETGIYSILRGLRAISDFEHELQLFSMNRHMEPQIDVFYMMTREQYFYLSSGMVKEIAKLGGDTTTLVPQPVAEKMREKFHHG